MLEPLRSWICDVCSEPIDRIEKGYVVWRLIGPQRKAGDFKIVHQSQCDPGSSAGFTHSLPLSMFLGAHGLAMLLSWLTPGPLRGPSSEGPDVANVAEYVDLVRRLQTPFYEEARQRFSEEGVQAALDDANQYLPYMPKTLQAIAEGKL